MPEIATKPFTHSAWMLKTEGMRKGRRIGRWIEEGVARLGPDGEGDIYLHSTPIGGIQRPRSPVQNRRQAARCFTDPAAPRSC